MASGLGAEMLNMSVDACGGMASDVLRLVRVISEEGERWTAGMWSSGSIERHLLSAIAIAVQRASAVSHSRRQPEGKCADDAVWIHQGSKCARQRRREKGSRAGRGVATGGTGVGGPRVWEGAGVDGVGGQSRRQWRCISELICFVRD